MDYKVIDNYAKQEIRESLLGLACFNPKISVFDYGCVVVQKNYIENEKVRIISGGPYFNCDFVGSGMLTCCIQGEHQMTPTSKTILRTLRELSYNHTRGIFILVPGSSENMFNFGLATERAKNDDLKVNLLQVNDAPDKNSLKKFDKKGSSGIVLLAKIAGAMSEQGKSLSEIYIQCSKLAKNLITGGINCFEKEKHICSLCRRNLCKEHGNITSNLYISESDCLYKVKNIINIHDDSSKPETGKINLKPDDCVVILINNNGSLKKASLFGFIRDVMQYLNTYVIHIKRLYLGNFVCPNDVAITFMKVDSQEILDYLDAACNAPGWNKVNQGSYNLCFEEPIKGRLMRKERLSPPVRGPKLGEKVANTLLYAMQFACDALISCERQLNTIDSERGKGDTGSKLRLVAEVLLKRMQKNKLYSDCPFTFFESLSKTLESAIGGTIGCIYSILFEAAATVFDQYSEELEITPFMWLSAFESAAAALQKYGNVKYGDGTMYDPICSCVRVARIELEAGITFIEAFSKGVEAAERAAIQTKKSNKYPDSGAHAVGIWMRAILEGIKLTYNP